MDILKWKFQLKKYPQGMGSTSEWKAWREDLSELRDKTIEIIQSEQWNKNQIKRKYSLRDIWNYNKTSNIGIFESQKEKKI